MAKGNFIQRLAGKFKTGVDAIHGRCIKLRRSASRRYNSRKTSNTGVPSSTRSPVYTLSTSSELISSFSASFDEIPHPQNHSRQRNHARTSWELRCITPEAPSLDDRSLQFSGNQGLGVVISGFTGSYELGDQTKPVDERTSSPTGSSDEPPCSPSTTDASSGWETDTLSSSFFSNPYSSDDCESETHHIYPITRLTRRRSADHYYFPPSMDESRNLKRSKSLPDLRKPRLRRVPRMNDLFLAAHGVLKPRYQSGATGGKVDNWRCDVFSRWF